MVLDRENFFYKGKIFSDKNPKYIIGLETETASIIPIKPTLSNNRLFQGLEDSSKLLDADIEIREYDNYFRREFFKRLNNIRITIDILKNIHKTYGIDDYNLDKFYTDKIIKKSLIVVCFFNFV